MTIPKDKVCVGPFPPEYAPIVCNVCKKLPARWIRLDRGDFTKAFCDNKHCRKTALPETNGIIPPERAADA